jgi:hypothetical protein
MLTMSGVEIVRADVKRKASTGEWVVRAWVEGKDGFGPVRYPAADSFETDEDAAWGTAKAMVSPAALPVLDEHVAAYAIECARRDDRYSHDGGTYR